MLLSKAEEILEGRKNQLEMLQEEKKELKKEIEEVTEEWGKQLEERENDFKSREKIEELEEKLDEAEAKTLYLEEGGIDEAKKQYVNLKGRLELLEAKYRDVFKVLRSLMGRDVEAPRISDFPLLIESVRDILQDPDVDIPDSPVSMGTLSWKQEFANWLNSRGIDLDEDLELPEPKPNVNKDDDEVFEVFFPVTSDRNLVKMEKSKLYEEKDLIHFWQERDRSAEEKAEIWLENGFQYLRERDWEPANDRDS